MSDKSRARRVQKDLGVESYQTALNLVRKYDAEAKEFAAKEGLPLATATVTVVAPYVRSAR